MESVIAQWAYALLVAGGAILICCAIVTAWDAAVSKDQGDSHD